VRITRDSDLEAMEEAEDLVGSFETALKKRKRGSIIRLKPAIPWPGRCLILLWRNLALRANDVIKIEGLLGISNLAELYAVTGLTSNFLA